MRPVTAKAAVSLTVIRALEKRQGFNIASPEEIAYRRSLVYAEQLIELVTAPEKYNHGNHFRKVITLK